MLHLSISGSELGQLLPLNKEGICNEKFLDFRLWLKLKALQTAYFK
jgi:hypothetical protein